MIAAAVAIVALFLVAPAWAGVTGARPTVALAASPAHVTLEGRARASVRVFNTGSESVVVDVRRAGFALDLRGRPKIVSLRSRRAGNAWFSVRPRRFALQAGASTTLRVTANPPHSAEPGDHDALVVLTTRRRARARIAVRMRLGVVVNVRVPGRIVHALVVGTAQVRHAGGTRVIEVMTANRGNVTEEVEAATMSLSLSRRGQQIAKLRPEPRQLLPRSRGLVLFRYRGPARGLVSALVRFSRESSGATAYRVFRLRL